MKQIKLLTLKANDSFEGFVIVRQSLVKVGQTGKSYIDMTINDQYSEMNAKIWDYNEERHSFIKSNILVKIKGTVAIWQNTPQLRVERIRLATEQDPVQIEDFVQSSPETGNQMILQVNEYISSIDNQDIKKIVSFIIDEYQEKLIYWPAAMANHHSIRGGLLYHTLTMLKAAKALLPIYPQLNPDLLYAGIILHDIEKINEMDANPLGLVSDYSTEGLLLGHIVQGAVKVAQIGEQLNCDKQVILLLQHMLISHHYEPEFGAIRRPMFPEAEMLHYLDMIDARMYDIDKALADVQGEAFTDKQWLLHNRRLFKHNL